MAGCTIRVLGGFAVFLDGTPAADGAWRSRRASDLVKILALSPAHQRHREQLMDLMWPNLKPEAAGANLRKAIHLARRAMGSPDAVRSRAGVVSLGAATVDIDAFLAASRAAERSGDRRDYEAAVELYAGDPLPADRYEPWAEDARAQARELYIAVLKGAGRWQRVLELDPIDEDAHRALMQHHIDSGRRREAIRQFEHLRDALREYMGVAPDPETVALYESILAMRGAEPPTPGERAASLIANALMQLNRGELDQAERLAREAKALALDAELSDEMGDASTLLAIVSFQTGRWHDVFREEFVWSLAQGAELARAVHEANLCFVEYYISGIDGYAGAEQYARELLALATTRRSAAGQGTAQLMLGEAFLFGGDLQRARDELRRAVDLNRRTGTDAGLSIALERLAKVEVALGNPRAAKQHLDTARPAALRSGLRSHTLVRLLGVEIEAAARGPEAQLMVRQAERALAELSRVCDPCAMDYHVQATIACAHGGDLARAGRHLDDAERISGMWQGGPWAAAVWEARAALRLAEGQREQAVALLHEAAAAFVRAQRPLDEARCRAAALQVAA